MNAHLLDAKTRQFSRILHYAGLLAALACATASYSWLHVPIFDDISRTAERIEELKLSMQNAAVIHEQHQRASERLATANQRIAKVRERVPSEADAGEFLSEVSRIASQENLAIKDFQPEAPTNMDGYAQMKVTLEGHGSYASICTFLDRIANLERLAKLQDLKLSATGNATEYPVTATLIIYFGLRGKDAKISTEEKRG